MSLSKQLKETPVEICIGTFFVIDRQIVLIFLFISLHTWIKSMFILGDSNNFGSEYTIHDSIRKENEVISSLFM